MDASHWSQQLRPLFDGRLVIVKHDVVAGAVPLVRAVRALGAAEVMVLATGGTGTGPLPEPGEATWYSLDVASSGTIAQAVHAGNDAIANLPAAARSALDRFDPDRTAVVVGDFLNESPELDGRPFLAYRRPEWLALDDKTVVDALWDRCGVTRSPSRVVPAETSAVTNAWSELDQGAGLVLAIDAADGWTGGASGVRRVQDRDAIDAALEGWRDPGREVRVMPFLEGIPCSIHGIVFPDHVVALRPVEMVVLRSDAHGFFYAGCASFWDPPEQDRHEMRELARRVGARLRTEVGYRGAFTVDGIMTADGFRPTELNPRNGAGLSTMARAVGIDAQLLLDAVVAEAPGNWCPLELEELLVAAFDGHRAGGTWHVVSDVVEPRDELRLTLDGDHLVEAERDAPADVTCMIGPSPFGSFVRAEFDAQRTPVGPSVGSLAASVWSYLAATHGLDTASLAPAPDVRS